MTIPFINERSVKKKRIFVVLTIFTGIVYLLILAFFSYKIVYDNTVYDSFRLIKTLAIIQGIAGFTFLLLFSYTIGIRGRIKAVRGNLILTIYQDRLQISDINKPDESITNYRWSEIKRISIIDQTSPVEKVFKAQYKLIRFILDDIKYDHFRNSYIPSAITKYHKKEYSECFFQMEYSAEAVNEIKKYWSEGFIVPESRW